MRNDIGYRKAREGYEERKLRRLSNIVRRRDGKKACREV